MLRLIDWHLEHVAFVDCKVKVTGSDRHSRGDIRQALAELMIKYGVGLIDEQTYRVKRVDPEYFGE